MTKAARLSIAENAVGAAAQVFPDGEGGVSDQDLASLRPPCKGLFPIAAAAETRSVSCRGS